MNLKNKIALVTGGSSGIGRAIAPALAAEGCEVVFTYNSNKKGAKETLKMLGSGDMFKVDMHSEDEIGKLFELIRKKNKKLDILVNNAGINSPRGLFKVDDWKEIFQVDLFSVVSFTGNAVDLMHAGGKILNITSIPCVKWLKQLQSF